VIGRGGVARLHVLPSGPYRHAVVLARPPLEATPAAVMRDGALAVHLTHGRGVTWPDAAGLAMACAALEAGDGVVLAFERLADAIACHGKLLAQAGAA
jgi:hypothetical protein